MASSNKDFVEPLYHIEDEPTSAEDDSQQPDQSPLLRVSFRSPVTSNKKPAGMNGKLNALQLDDSLSTRAPSYRMAIGQSSSSSPARGVQNPHYYVPPSMNTARSSMTARSSISSARTEHTLLPAGTSDAEVEMIEHRDEVLDAADEVADKIELKQTRIISKMNTASFRRRYPTNYFNDGARKIDFVLAFEPESHEHNPHFANRRETFERHLVEAGLELEIEPAECSTDGQTAFVKIHAPFKLLCRQAELLRIRMPIKKNDIEDDSITGLWHKLTDKINLLKINEKYDVDTPLYFTAPFSVARMNQFMIADKDTFFSNSQRSRLVYDQLIRARFDVNNPEKVGSTRLINQNVYTAAFPLHEGEARQPFRCLRWMKEIVCCCVPDCKGAAETCDPLAERPTDRQLLYTTWARFSQFYKEQPLDLIRKYNGEKIAIYFAWLGFYTNALWPAAIIGILCVLYGLTTYDTDTPTQEVCHGTNITMCPVCPYDNCKLWTLNVTCFESQITHVFDNGMTVVFAVVMSIWATFFLEGWTRYRYELAWKWDLLSSSTYAEESEVRPEFEMKVRGVRKNPVTQLEEPFLPFFERCWRTCFSAVTVLFFLLLVSAFVFGVIVYRLIIMALLQDSENMFYVQYASWITSLTAACINLIVIILLGKVYQRLAYKLTEWEYPRTDVEFENSYTIKVFLFQFINYYSSLFYIAFMRGKVTTVPGETSTKMFKKYQWEGCPPSGCMVELLIQLAIIMVGKQVMTNVVEICFPILQNYYTAISKKLSKSRKSSKEVSQWERDYALAEVYRDCLFDEYLEMVIQYGFVTLFVAAFPLAPFFALLNNLVEIRLDAFKFVVALRRPMPAKAVDLGVWKMILDGISRLAVLTNACVIAFTSEYVPKMLYFLTYGGGSMEGYVNFSLSYYNTTQLEVTSLDVGNNTYCRFRDWRRSPCSIMFDSDCDPTLPSTYPYSIKWWHVMAAKLAFVLIFEHFVFLIKEFVAYLIPDLPTHILVKMQREQYLTRESNMKADKQDDKDDEMRMSNNSLDNAPRQLLSNRNPSTDRPPTGTNGDLARHLIVDEDDKDSDSVYYSPRQSAMSLTNHNTRL